MLAAEERYWAFLSYSHADARAARKLHCSLEAHVLPNALRRRHGMLRRLIPIFQDQEELAAAPGLTRRLQRALDSSRWLIVLCSESSARSMYVDLEIRHVLATRGPQHILCAMLDGEPPHNLPRALRDLSDEPLAADLRSGAHYGRGIQSLVAALSGVDLGELRNREAKRRRIRWHWVLLQPVQ